MTESTATLRAILHAAVQVLRCASVALARYQEERQALVLAVSARAASQLEAVETALGVQVSGLEAPLRYTNSLLVRAFLEERILVTDNVTEIAGGALPQDAMQAVFDMIGPHSFASVPVTGRGGALGVMLFIRAGQDGFTTEERDLLLMYADRVGAELESEALSDEAQHLEHLGQAAPAPPSLWACVPGPLGPSRDEPQVGLLCRGGAADGHPLHTVLGIADPESLWNQEVQRRLQAGETVPLHVTASDGVHGTRPLRVTLRGAPGGRAHSAATPVPPMLGDTSLLCAVEDLGWSERLRRGLVLAREHLAKVMHSVGDAILTVDAAGAVQQANQACKQVLGLGPQALIGRSALDLAATGPGREQLVLLRERLGRSGFAERQLPLVRQMPDGTRRSFPAQLSALLLGDEDGMPAGAVWRIHDQTERRRGDAERRRLRLRLLQTERLSALGEMAARIAHEVRNPLVSIGAAAQVVAEELPADSPVQGEVGAICSEVRRLDHIISDFLRFARPRRRGMQAADVRRALREVADLMRPKAGGLTIRVEEPQEDGPEQGLRALIDVDSLKQVLWNVLLNACEAARPAPEPADDHGGAAHAPDDHRGAGRFADDHRGAGRFAIHCEARLGPDKAPGQERAPGAKRGSAAVLITVADRGPGIPAAVRRRVFDPFFSTKARGTGLGLSICKQIIEEHGGRIRLLSRAGGGTLVVIELQPAPAQSAVAALRESCRT